MEITVDGATHTLTWGDHVVTCALGRAGVVRDKREGDGGTPAGVFPLRQLFYRADRLAAPKCRLKARIIQRDDGWCDDPGHDAYNRHIRRPFQGGHEQLWRSDPVYDLIVPLGYNDDPVMADLGSAIFLHLAAPDYGATDGCVALALDDLLDLLGAAGPESRLNIV